MRNRARFALEPLDELVVARVLGVEDLQRDVPLEQAVVRSIDARHAAVSDELLDVIASGDGLPDHDQKLPA